MARKVHGLRRIERAVAFQLGVHQPVDVALADRQRHTLIPQRDRLALVHRTGEFADIVVRRIVADHHRHCVDVEACLRWHRRAVRPAAAPHGRNPPSDPPHRPEGTLGHAVREQRRIDRGCVNPGEFPRNERLAGDDQQGRRLAIRTGPPDRLDRCPELRRDRAIDDHAHAPYDVRQRLRALGLRQLRHHHLGERPGGRLLKLFQDSIGRARHPLTRVEDPFELRLAGLAADLDCQAGRSAVNG